MISHALWTNVAGRASKFNHKTCLWLAAFGIMPDIVAFGYNFVTQLAGRWNLAVANSSYHLQQALIPKITFPLFNFSHSLVIFATATAIVWIALGRPYIPIIGWGAHILIDIPTHSINFFPPNYLFPLHTPLVNGFSWANPYFMLFNMIFLLFIYHEMHLKKHTIRLLKIIFGKLK